jgi:pSer/pThr/pTyr-binding forkhead associated (FHA) protein
MFGIQEFVGLWKKGDHKHYCLVPIDGWSEDARSYKIHAPATIGRGSQADVRLTDPWISRSHCELAERDGVLTVRDLESRHGVYVNDERVTQAELHRGDVLMLGVSRFRVDYDDFDPDSSEARKDR